MRLRECLKSTPTSVMINPEEILQIQGKDKCSLLRAVATGLIDKKKQQKFPPEKRGSQLSYCNTLQLLIHAEKPAPPREPGEESETRLRRQYFRSLFEVDRSGFKLLDASSKLVKGLVRAAKENPHFRANLDEDYGSPENLLRGNREAIHDYKTAYYHAYQNGLGPSTSN